MLLIVASFQVLAKEIKDVHYTTLLPLITNLSSKDEKFLEERIVKQLLNHKDFQYKSHDGFYQIIKKQGKKLKTALHSDEVLRTVAEKLSVGSMIRVEVNEFLLGYEVTLDIFSKEAKLLYSRKKRINQKSVELLSSVVNFWIQGYTKETPFDATIVEVQGETLLIDYPGKNEELFPNKQFVVIRQIIDPLETDDTKKEVFKEIAYGVVIEINEEYFIGKILETKENLRILASDFVQFKIFDEEIAAKNPDYKYRRHDLGNYRENGKFSLFGTLMKVQGDDNAANFTGALFNADFFLPSNMLLLFEFARKIGQTSGEKTSDSKAAGSSLNDTSYKALLGYSITPKTLKYLSYVDVYGGWSVDQNYLSGLGILGVGDVSFEGPVVGVRMEHPFYPNLSGLTGFEYNIQPQFKEKKTSLGEAESTTGYMLQLGMRYRFHKSGICIEGQFRRKSNTADIKDSDMELNITSNQVMIGISNFF